MFLDLGCQDVWSLFLGTLAGFSRSFGGGLLRGSDILEIGQFFADRRDSMVGFVALRDFFEMDVIIRVILGYHMKVP